MRCPNCGSHDDRVLESRALANGDAVRRRRVCEKCGFRFTSYERIEDKQLAVVKRDGRREPFDRRKIERGVERALEKRPVSRMRIESLVNEVEDEAAIMSGGSGEVPCGAIGDAIMERLGALDKVAYVRFASVYRHFETLDEFVREIGNLEGGSRRQGEDPGGTAG